MISPLATPFPILDRGPKRKEFWGACMHQTGIGIVNKAIKEMGIDIKDPDAVFPLAEYIGAHYANGNRYGAHINIGWDGFAYGLADEEDIIYHCGFDERNNQELTRLRAPDWRKECAPAYLKVWDERHPGVKNPLALFPGTSVNNRCIGMELTPLHKDSPWMAARYPEKHGRFTRQQHETARGILVGMGRRWGLHKDWRMTDRLFPHEAVNPISRANRRGGWDLGVYRENPWFDWPWLQR